MFGKNVFSKILQSALALDLPYSHPEQRMLLEKLKPNPIPAAVLILFAYDPQPSGRGADETEGRGEGETSLSVLYMLRTETVLAHKGQISFPGGVTHPEDGGDPRKTALRETFEEVGIDPSQVRTVGELPSLLTVTGFEIRPIIGITEMSRRKLEIRINPLEVAEILWVELDELMRPGTYREETLNRAGISFPVDVYLVGESAERRSHRIWGATGSITKNLLDRLALVHLNRP